jgi:hypothetical protein
MTKLFNKVEPGDLITSDFINSILEKITSLESRISQLESEDNKVVITGLVPKSGPYRINQRLQIDGYNFEFMEGNLRVEIDVNPPVVPVVNFIFASDYKLIFNIPDIPNIPESGKDVDLVIRNRSSRAIRNIRIEPAQESLQGTVNVVYISVEPLTLTENQQADFMYKLISSTNIPADFIITPTISEETNPESWPQPQVLDDQKIEIETHRISMLATDEKIFYIRISNIPPDTNNTTFHLKVKSESGIVKKSDIQEFKIGVETEQQDDTFSLIRNYSDPPDILNADKTIISLEEKEVGYIYLEAKDFTFVGNDVSGSGEKCDIYEFELNTGEETIGWGETLEGIGMPDRYEIKENEVKFSKSPYFKLQPGTGASKKGMIEFSMKRRGASKRRFLLFELSLAE